MKSKIWITIIRQYLLSGDVARIIQVIIKSHSYKTVGREMTDRKVRWIWPYEP